MRILLVNWQDRENPQAGGAEIHLHEIFRRIAGMGHDVSLLCSGWRGAPARLKVDGIDVHRVGERYTFPLQARRYWARHLRAAGHDVLYEDINKVPLYTPRWGAKKTVAFVPHLFGGTVFQEAGLAVGTAVWLSERPLAAGYRNIPFEALSQSTRDDLIARGIPAALVRVIYPGVAFDEYTPNAAERSRTPLFAYVGRLKKYKRVDAIIDAFALIEDQSSRLEIAGAGDYRPALEALARAHGVAHRVTFRGFITEEDKRSLYRRAWAVSLTSPKEGWGLTNLEAAASGTPVVTSNSPGIRESVRHEETGFLVPHGDVAALASRFKQIASDPALVAAMGDRARDFAVTFTWETAARMTEEHLREVVSGR